MDELHRLADELKKLQPGTPEREAYLEKLRVLVESGEYHADADELARKLLDDATGRRAL